VGDGRITIARSVPLNAALAATRANAPAADSLWSRHLVEWTAWHARVTRRCDAVAVSRLQLKLWTAVDSQAKQRNSRWSWIFQNDLSTSSNPVAVQRNAIWASRQRHTRGLFDKRRLNQAASRRPVVSVSARFHGSSSATRCTRWPMLGNAREHFARVRFRI